MKRKLAAAAPLIVTLASFALAAEPAADGPSVDSALLDGGGPRGWSVHFDNDLFAFTRQDKDYTAGISVTLGGDDALGAKQLSRALDWLDERTGSGRSPSSEPETVRSFEAGVLLFTPQDLEAADPLVDDRPYANLTYLSSSRLTYDATKPVAHQSSLTVGLLGVPLVGRVHRSLHVAGGSQEPMGYRHQISDGGEPTLRYAVSRYRLLDSGSYSGWPYHLRAGLTGSVGYLTEASAELAFKWGNLNTPWWDSSPSISDYAAHPPVRLVSDSAEPGEGRFQVSAGVNLRVRAYNSLLQGQIRSSDVTHGSSRLNHVLLEAWLGLTTVFANHLSVSYTLRHQTAELRSRDGARDLTWASIGIAQQF